MNTDRLRIVLLGPTASGKSTIAAQLANRLNGVVISADSRQVYSEMKIGTAVPEPELLALAPHYNVQIISPREEENIQRFLDRVSGWENEIGKKKPIIYVGGSTLYLQALLFGIDKTPTSNQENLNALKNEAKTKGIEFLFEKLKKVDPIYAGKMDGFNTQRIIRALDVYIQTGQPYSSFHNQTDYTKAPDGFVVYGLNWPREKLYERINLRVDEMLKAGLTDEVISLLKKYDASVQSLQTVGYKEPIAYLNGKFSIQEMTEEIKKNTRRYAKRQLTWFRRWPFIEWIDMGMNTPEEVIELISQKHKKVVSK